MTRVMVFGTFDGLHAGHDYFLSRAAALGDELVVVIARDHTVQKVKGRTPKIDERRRLERISQHHAVTHAVFGAETDDKLAIVYAYNPDIICLGYDQHAFVHKLHKAIQQKKLIAKIVRVDPHRPDELKSSLLNATQNSKT